MQIRKITKEEQLASEKIAAIAFVQPLNITEPNKDAGDYNNVWGAFDDNGTMTARVTIHPFEVMFNGNKVKMGGVGGVAALPEYRGQGAVKALMLAAMRKMYDSGVMFSYLYPFSHKYYRKFGYELCFNRTVARIPLRGLVKRPASGKLELLKQEDDIEPYINIYKQFIKGYNLAVARSKENFKKFLPTDPYKTCSCAYLWKDDTGAPQAYICFTAEKQAGNAAFDMKVKEMAFTSADSFCGILSTLSRFSVEYADMVWEVPADVDPVMLTDEPWDIKTKTERGGMNRVINVEAALALISPPMGEGAVIISVTDACLPQNNGTYKISWESGRVSVSRTDKAADTAMDICSLTRLITGYCLPHTLELAGNIEILKNHENLNLLFSKKNLHITDRF